jgi:hypothetical protein
VTLEDMGIPSHLVQPAARYDVRATRLALDRLGLAAELWIGGGHTVVGNRVLEADLEHAWVVDCAGDLPPYVSAAARLFIPRVFDDIEQVPLAYDRIEALARELALVLSDGHEGGRGTQPPARLYVLCKQGFNRSALLGGRILRALGMPGEEAVRLIREHRPGAVANLAFERLILEDRSAGGRPHGQNVRR